MTDLTTDPAALTPEYTHQVGDLIAEAVRVLNHATLGDAPGLDWPADAYDLIGYLKTAAERLPQLLTQIAAFLDGWQASGQLADTTGDDPTRRASVVFLALGEASGHALQFAESLTVAHNASSYLYVKDDPDA
jgi:hypothetical protein